jgi:serine/threonine-protein kinase
MPVREEIIGVDPVVVMRCLDGLGIKFTGPLRFERIGLGQSNLTYLVRDEAEHRWVPESGYGWKLGDVDRDGELLTVSMASNGAMTGAAACQQVLGVRENVDVGTRSCNDVDPSIVPNYDPVQGWRTDPKWATNDAAQMAIAMLSKVKV